jgi:hypothetical protein
MTRHVISPPSNDALRKVYSITSSATVRQTEFKIPWAEIIKVCLSSIPRSRHDPKILWVDDAKIVGD